MDEINSEEVARPANVIELGADCTLSGSYVVSVTIPRDPIYADDEQQNVELSFEGVPLACASQPYEQRKKPDSIKLRLHVWDDEIEGTPAGNLLKSLQMITTQQRESEGIYGDDQPVANLDHTPIISIGEPTQARDFQSRRPYTDIFFTVRRSALTLT